MKAIQKAQRRRVLALRLLVASALAATLAGCYRTDTAQVEYPFDYRQRHPITVREGTQSVEVMVGRNRGGLTPSQRLDVVAFAQSWRRDSSSGVIIDVPHGGPTDRAAAESMREIRSIFAAVGLPANAIYVRSYRPTRYSLASIKLNYSRLVADAGPCGEWPADLGTSWKSTDMENRPYWNLGCASQRNLAAMVENPADLIQPRGETPPYAPRRSTMMNRYTKGESPSSTYVGFDTGKITDIGR